MPIGLKHYAQANTESHWTCIYLYLFRPDRQGGSLAVMEQLVEANYNMENIYMI